MLSLCPHVFKAAQPSSVRPLCFCFDQCFLSDLHVCVCLGVRRSRLPYTPTGPAASQTFTAIRIPSRDRKVTHPGITRNNMPLYFSTIQLDPISYFNLLSFKINCSSCITKALQVGKNSGPLCQCVNDSHSHNKIMSRLYSVSLVSCYGN